MVVSSESSAVMGSYGVPRSPVHGSLPLLLQAGPGVWLCQDTLPCSGGGSNGAEPVEGHLAPDIRLGPCCVPAMGRSLKSEMKLMQVASRPRVEGSPLGWMGSYVTLRSSAACEKALLS